MHRCRPAVSGRYDLARSGFSRSTGDLLAVSRSAPCGEPAVRGQTVGERRVYLRLIVF
jgi:hypothetical protein